MNQFKRFIRQNTDFYTIKKDGAFVIDTDEADDERELESALLPPDPRLWSSSDLIASWVSLLAAGELLINGRFDSLLEFPLPPPPTAVVNASCFILVAVFLEDMTSCLIRLLGGGLL